MEQHYGGFWKRALAISIDMMALYFISMILGSISIVILSIASDTALTEGISETANGLLAAWYAMGLVTNLFYFTYFPATTGQTLGKKILGLKIVKLSGEPIGKGTAFLRWMGYLVSFVFFCLGFIWVIFDRKRQGWHDKIAETVVLDIKFHKPVADKNALTTEPPFDKNPVSEPETTNNGSVAQSVEHRTENPSVGSSILP
jgi:uncharacterized RDD family membrane protein YckC